MAPVQVDSSKLDEVQAEQVTVRRLLEAHVSNFRIFTTKLMGDDDGENPAGRIPRIETVQSDHGERIARLERLMYRILGGLGALALATAQVECVYRLLALVEHK